MSEPSTMALQLEAALAEVDRLTGVVAERDKALAESITKLGNCVDGLQTIYRHDTTSYQHHQARGWDGLTPEEALGPGAGTIWLTPRELARALLRYLGATVPDSLEEMRARVARRNADQETTT
jgi:hypothetical protein